MLITLSAIALGMGVSANFWLPIVLENDSVNLQNLIGVALLDYRNFFVPLGDLLMITPRHDAGAINGLSELTIPRYCSVGISFAWWTICIRVLHTWTPFPPSSNLYRRTLFCRNGRIHDLARDPISHCILGIP